MCKPMPQSLHLAEERVQEVKRLMTAGSEFYAFQAMELANKDFGRSQLRLGMYYIWARLKEEGILGEVDTDGALEDFTFLAQHDGDFRSEGLIGRARMLYRKSPEKNADEILSLCRQAVDLDASVAAMMLMGVVFEHDKCDFGSAKKWYFRAYRSGQPWGLRFYTAMQFKRKKFLVSMLASVVLAVTSPLMVKIYGERAPFKA